MYKRLLAKLITVVYVFVVLFGSISSVHADNSYSTSSIVNKGRDKKEIIIKYKDPDKADAIKSSIQKKLKVSKLESKKSIKDNKLDVIEVGDSDNIEVIINELNNNSDVEYAQPNYKLKIEAILPADPYFTEQWGLKNTGQAISGQLGTPGMDINVSNVWDVTLGSPDLVIGIIDSGTDIRHPDLSANIYKNLGEVAADGIDNDKNGYIDDISGWDFAHGDSTVFDAAFEDDHGTHIAGIIAAVKDTKGVVGVAPNVKLMPLKFIVGDEGGYTSDAIEAINYAKRMNVKIVNCSWGGPDNNIALKEAIGSSDMLFINAAGNDGKSIDLTPVYPAAFNLPNMINVAAIDNRGNLASFSNYGTLVHVAAPGWNIKSTIPNNQYAYYNGTSMAAPYVTGIAALLKSAKPNMTTLQMATAIKAGVNKISSLNGKVSTGGVVDAELAVIGIKAPNTVSATSTDNSVTITWGAITSAASYDVSINNEIISLGKVTTYTKTGLIPNTNYKFSVRAKNATATSGWSIEKSIVTKPEGYITLDFVPTDSVMHPTQPIIYITDKQNKMLYKINYETKAKTSVSLDLPPERVKLVNNEVYVTLLKGEHSSYWWEAEQSGVFLIMNPDDLTIKDRYDIDIDPYDIEIDKDGYIYISGGSGQWTYINSYSRASKIKIAQRNSLHDKSYLRYNEQNNKLYNINSGNISPNDIESNNINQGVFSEKYDSRYHGDFEMGTNMKISPDGKYLICNSGNVFESTIDKSTDIMHAVNIGSSFKDIVFDTQNNTFYIAKDKQIVAYNYDYFNKAGTINLSGNSEKLFKQNDKLISISQTNNSYYIEAAKTSYIIESPKETYTNAIKLPGKIIETIYDKARNKVYAADTGLRNLYIVDMATRKIEKTINLPYIPNGLCLSEDNNKIYIANNDPTYMASEIDLNTLAVTRNLKFSAEMNHSKESHGHIYNKNGKLYIVNGEWSPKLYVFDESTLAQIINTPVIKDVGGMYFTNDNSRFYYWHQYGWSAGWAGTYVYNYLMNNNSYTLSSKTNMSWSEFGRDPLDSPLLVQEDKGLLFNKNIVFDTNDLTTVKGYFPNGETIYAIDNTGTIAVSQNKIFNIGTYAQTSLLPIQGSQVQYFDNDNRLIVLKDNLLTIVSGVAPGAPITITSVTADKASPQLAGTTIRWTSNITGGQEPSYYYRVYKGNTMVASSTGYTLDNYFDWKPTEAGNDYRIRVFVKENSASPTTAVNKFSDYYVVNPQLLPISITSITADKASPQLAGTAIRWTGNITGGSNPVYYFRVYKGSTMVASSNGYVSNNYFDWTPTEAGSDYRVRLNVKESDADASTYIYKYSDYYTVNPSATQPISITSVTPDKASPQLAGTTIRWTGNITGGTNPVYYFRVYKGTTIVASSNGYVANNYFDWTPTEAGSDYRVRLNVKENDAEASTYIYKYSDYYTVNPSAAQPLSITSVTPDKASPQLAGTAIRWTGNITGGTNPVYYFRVYKGTTIVASSNGYVANNYFNWTPTEAGSDYRVRVNVKESDAEVATAIYKYSSYYTIEPSATQPISITSVTPDKASPQLEGTTIRWTSNITGGQAPVYYFRVYKGTTIVASSSGYTASNNFDWTPTEAGSDYRVRVNVKENDAEVATAIYKYSSYYTVNPSAIQPISITSVTPDKASPQLEGTTIRWTGNITGGSNPVYYFRVYKGTTIVASSSGYTASNNFDWTPTEAGSDYRVRVNVKESDAEVATAIYKYSSYYTVNPSAIQPISIISVTADKASPQAAGTTIRWTGNITGGQTPVYYFRVYKGTTIVASSNGYVSSNTFDWTPAEAGSDYRMRVYVKESSAEASTAVNKFSSYLTVN